MSAESFTMFEKFGEAVRFLDADDRSKIFNALCEYGFYGTEVELPPYLMALFVMMKDDIDNSKESRQRGSKGGRPRTRQVSETSKPEVSETSKPEVSETSKPEVSEKSEKSKTQTNTNQTNTNQVVKEKEKKEKRRFAPPSVEEVWAYCVEKRLNVDARAFVDFYESKGWKVGNSPMKSWQAACRTWANREKQRGAGAVKMRGEPVHDEYSYL